MKIKKIRNYSFLTLCVLSLFFLWPLGVEVFAQPSPPLSWKEDANVLQILLSFSFIALVVERAVGLLASIWSDLESSNRKNACNEKNAWLIFLATFILGLISSMLGIRFLGSMLTTGNNIIFLTFDIILSALAIAGGSQVFHQALSTITDFTKTARKQAATGK